MNAVSRIHKTVGQRLDEQIVMGKDILELVSSSMYVDPLTIFREYIQNSVDSIDEAVATGIFQTPAEARIDITLDPSERRVLIRDTGGGVRKERLNRTMTAFGASKKRGTNARGFRGVGRLSGLAYCKSLIFRTRHLDEQVVSEVRWDCEQLKALLRDHSYTGSLDSIVREVASAHRCDAGLYPAHFFEVEMLGVVRIKNDILLNTSVVSQYLSQVGPVPFSPDFALGKEIVPYLREFGLGEGYNIFVNKSLEPIYRPFRDTFEARSGAVDAFQGFERFEIDGISDGRSAVGWVLHHGYKGALRAGVGFKGVRLRKGNIQVGNDDLLDEIFDERRFNSWCVAEFHVVAKNLVPNGRRDSFDLNRDYQDLVSKLRPIAKAISKLCRSKSNERNCSHGKPEGVISAKQEAILSRFPHQKQSALREFVGALYHLKGGEAATLVTTLLAHLTRGLTSSD